MSSISRLSRESRDRSPRPDRTQGLALWTSHGSPKHSSAATHLLASLSVVSPSGPSASQRTKHGWSSISLCLQGLVRQLPLERSWPHHRRSSRQSFLQNYQDGDTAACWHSDNSCRCISCHALSYRLSRSDIGTMSMLSCFGACPRPDLAAPLRHRKAEATPLAAAHVSTTQHDATLQPKVAIHWCSQEQDENFMSIQTHYSVCIRNFSPLNHAMTCISSLYQHSDSHISFHLCEAIPTNMEKV